MPVLLADLGNESCSRVEISTAEKGLELGVSLYREYESGSPVIISSPPEGAAGFPGPAVFTIVYRSPVSGRITFSYSSLPHGLSLRVLGYDALVITGKAERLSLLSVGSDGGELSDASAYASLPSAQFEENVRKSAGELFLSAGPAAVNGVLYSVLQAGGRTIDGEGLGFLFAQKGLKGISFPSFARKDLLANGEKERRVRRRIERSRFSKRMRKEGGGLYIDALQRLGALPVLNHSRRFDPRAFLLDGKAFSERYGMYPDSCQDCFLACYRRCKDGTLLPSWKEIAALGPDLGIFSPDDVCAIAAEVRSAGLSAAAVGAMLAALGKDGRWTREECVEAVRAVGGGQTVMPRLPEIPGAVVSGSGFPVPSDLRGDYPGAIAAAYGIPLTLHASILMPRHPLGVSSSAVIALYESVFSLALISEGFSPMGSVVLWWSRIPSFVYRVPFLLRNALCFFSAYGMKADMLAEKGLRLLSVFSGGREVLPEIFAFNPDSALEDGRTVPYTRLCVAYEEERSRLETRVKSRREKMERRSASKSAAVGPADERGREGDPGLTK